MNQLKKATILSFVNIFSRNIVAIFITPLMIHKLGDSEYGLYSFIGAIVGYLFLLDFGLSDSITRFVAQYRTQNSKEEEQNFLAVSLLIFLAIAILVAIVGVIFYFNINKLYSGSFTFNEIKKTKIMLIILIFDVIIAFPGKSFLGIIKGYEHFAIIPLINLLKLTLRTIFLITILFNGTDAVGIVILDTCINVFIIAGASYYVFFKLKIKIKLYEFKLSYIKEILGYSVWVFIMSLVFQFQWSTGQAILGTRYNTEVIAVFSIGIMLGLYFNIFGGVINGMLLPQAVKSIYKGADSNTLTEQLTKVGRLTLLVLTFILIGFLLLGKEFILLWVGPNFKNAWYIALIIMITYTLQLPQGYTHSILEAQKKLKFKTVSLLITTAIGLISGYFLLLKYGPVGLVLGIAGSMILFHALLNVYYIKVLKLNMLKYYKNSYLKFILPSLIILVLTKIIFSFIEGVTFINFTFQSAIYAVIFIVISYLFILNKIEKKMLLDLIPFPFQKNFKTIK